MANAQLYYIGWRSKQTGFEGHGTSTFVHAVAQQICEKADAEFPEIEHFPVPAPMRPVFQEIEENV